MSKRSVYLAKSGSGPAKRAHFGVFIPDPTCDRATLSQDFRAQETVGTIVHVVGEPLMAGCTLEMKRHFDGQNDLELKKLIHLGSIDRANVYTDSSLENMIRDYVPKSVIERLAASIPLPPRGQNVRAPIDGVKTKRCQEWTMEFLTLLINNDLIDQRAVDIVQGERDSPTHGIFGYKG